MNKNGFTLIELIMIIVLVGVVFPLILAPFLISAKEVSTPAEISRLTMLARGNMDVTLDAVITTWPTQVTGTQDYTATYTYTDPDTSNVYTTNVTGTFVDSTLTATDTATLYLLLDLTTSDSAGNRSVNLITLKASNYIP